MSGPSCASPMLGLLCEIADDESGVSHKTHRDPPPPHPVLANETTKSIILRFHQQRAHLQHALEVCAKANLEVPNVLMEALHYIITDTLPVTGAGSPTSPSERSDQNHSARPSSAAALCQDALSLTKKRLNMDLSDFLSADKGDATTVEEHISLATHALLNHPNHPGRVVREVHAAQAAARELASGNVSAYSPSRTSAEPKRLLEAAHEARRSGNPRAEIKILVDYLRRGQEGSLILDTSATTRILRQLADAHIGLGEYVSAEQYLFDWYMIAEKVGDRSDAVRALMQLGSCCHKRGDVAAATDWLTQAKLRAPERQKV